MTIGCSNIYLNDSDLRNEEMSMKPKVIVYKKVDKKVLEFIENFCDIVYFEKLASHNSPLFLKELKAK